MALDPTKDEDIEKEIRMDKLENFWNTYKWIIAIVVLIVIVAFGAFQYSKISAKKSGEAASQIYQDIITINIDNIEMIRSGVTKLKDNHADTPYSSRGAILLSRSLASKNLNDEAITELIWAADNSVENSIQSLALYSLSNMYLVSENLEDAMIAANRISTPGYIGLKNDLLGDIYIASNDKEKARISYDAALNFYQNKSELAKVIQTKIDAISQ
jgi:predicted negative regulator of RcsB-dependent stress response